MPFEWNSIPLGEVIVDFDNRRVPVKESERRSGPYPYYGASGIVDHVDGFIFEGRHLLIAEDGENLKTRQTPIAFLADGKYWVNNHAHVVRANHRSRTEFLCYALAYVSVQPYLTGSTMPKLTQGNMRRIMIPLPPIEDQNQIVATLGILDDKIALLQKTNATLEAIAQALFKSWFVGFDPVRAKAEGCEPEGMSPEVAGLFPSEFEESELGEIPKGWQCGTLADSAELNPESWSNKSHPESILYVDLANTKDNRIESVAEYSFDEAPSRARRVLRDGDTIVGTVRPGNRSFAFIQEPPLGLTGSTGFAVLRPRMPHDSEFVFIAATRTESIDILANLADGGAYPAVRPELVQQLQVVVPPETILQVFHEITSPLMKRVGLNSKEVDGLAGLRDTLLPRLMSGKLHVHEMAGVLD